MLFIEEKRKIEDSTKGSSKTEDSTKGSSKGELDNTKTTIVPAKGREWFEAKSPEGYSYYWNVSTNGDYPFCTYSICISLSDNL